MKKIKVLLVHGTFANMTNWDDCEEERDEEHNIYKGDGPFVGQLRALLQDRGVDPTFSSFNWSGENSHGARREAAIALNEEIQSHEGRPVCRDGLFLIGHSHGGTVARLAVNTEPCTVDPTGVITFGSPFVRFEPRPVDLVMIILLTSWRIALLIFFIALLGLTQGGAAVLFLFHKWIGRQIGAIDTWLEHKIDYLTDIRDELCQEFDPHRVSPVPYLNYHARFDEAGLLLRFWSVPTWIANTAFAAVINAAGVLFGLILAVFFYELIFVWGYFAETDLWLRYEVFQPLASFIYGQPVPKQFVDELGLNAFAYGGTTILTLVLITALIAPVCIYFPWFLRRSWVSFGGEAPSWTIASRIRVDRLGGEQAEIRNVFLPAAWRNGTMQHNYYYSDQALIEELADRLADWKITITPTLFVERRFFSLLGLIAQLYVIYLALWFAIDITVI
ncbi:MAG: hypothetical protein AAGC79_11640 [Pseudomonadota bacterium]